MSGVGLHNHAKLCDLVADELLEPYTWNVTHGPVSMGSELCILSQVKFGGS